MNILEAYIEKNNSIIILITGINIELLNSIGEILSKDLSLPLIKLNEVLKTNYYLDSDKPDTTELENLIKKNKNNVIVGFKYPINNKIDFHFNIKFNSNIFMKNQIKNSKNIYEEYKIKLKEQKIDKFLKYEDDKEETNNSIFNYLLDLIKKNVYENENTIFNSTEKSTTDLTSQKSTIKKNKNWDKDNLYLNIDDYTNKMLETEIYVDKHDDDDIFFEMENNYPYSGNKIEFIRNDFFKNFKGGSKIIVGIRYL